MRRRTTETVMSVVGLVVLLGTLIAFDPRVRDQVGTIIARDSSETGLMGEVGEITSALVLSARDQSLEHAPLLVFSVAAAVLVIFMLRT